MPYVLRRASAQPRFAQFQLGFRDFPGPQGNNPVGFAAASGFPGFSGTVQIGSTLNLVNGSPGSPTLVQFQDVRPKTGQKACAITANGSDSGGAVHDIKFFGCRFCSNAAHSHSLIGQDSCVDMLTGGSSNITFSYCTFSPLPSLSPNPVPALAWPSSSVGTGAVYGSSVPNYANYLIPYANAYRDAVSHACPPGSTTIYDHCDMWGAGDTFTCSSIGWQSLNNPISTSCGQTLVTDCWLHDNRNDFPPNWSPGITYQIDDIVTGSNSHVYIATGTSTGSNPTLGGPWFDQNPSGAGNDHTNGTMCPNSNSFANVTFQHCTISGIGNTNNVAWQHLLNASNNFDATANYSIGAIVAGLDGFVYTALTASGPSTIGPKDPTGNAFPSNWVQNGGGNPPHWFNQFQNIAFKNCHLSGFTSMIDMGANNSGQSGMVFEDNVISNAVMYGARLVYTGVGTYTGPYVPLSNLFLGQSGNSWRRNRYQAWPGSSGWDVNSGKDGWYVWPDGDISLNQTTDWHN